MKNNLYLELTDRTKQIFKTVVESYLETGSPSGSETVLKRAGLDISSASVRNILSSLQKEGLLFSPHTSAGRMPTDKGMRFFVDGLLEFGRISKSEKENMLLNYRLAFLSDTWVNWCEGLGTVLANDEVKDGLSERGGFPVEQKLMKQWSLRITAYADRLIAGLDTVDWSDSIKEIQKNWIGKSKGASVSFSVENSDSKGTGSDCSEISSIISSESKFSSEYVSFSIYEVISVPLCRLLLVDFCWLV